MIGPRKIIIGIIASAFVGLTLLLAVAIIAPKVVDSEAVKAKVRSEIKEKSAVEIGFKHLALDFFPHPHVILEQVTLAIPPGVKGKAVSVTVQPKILPLFLDKPQLNLSANLALTQTTPPLSLQVKGSQIDVSSTRQMVLAVAGKNDDVKDIFDIVKGGSVPLITLKSQGDSLSDLGDTDNMVIRGQMRDGEIYLPDIQFDLKNATGEVVISQGILEGHNLQARLGNSSGQNGSLKLGLIGDVAPFQLETDVRADLSQLAPILKRLVEKET
jgi:uncharacterized protein involved in outer membrane biogenesis